MTLPDTSLDQNGYAAPVADRVYAATPERESASAPYVQPASAWDYRQQDGTARPGRLAVGLSVSWLTVVVTSLGVWLFLRWQRERNRPVNRLRRQAKQAAGVLRERVPLSKSSMPGLPDITRLRR